MESKLKGVIFKKIEDRKKKQLELSEDYLKRSSMDNLRRSINLKITQKIILKGILLNQIKYLVIWGIVKKLPESV